MPVGFSDSVTVYQTVLSHRRGLIGQTDAQTLALDPTINDDMGNVDASRSMLPSGALSHRAQSCFGRSESNKRPTAAYRGSGTRQQEAAAAPVPLHVPCCQR
jgi:hypothetical protein